MLIVPALAVNEVDLAPEAMFTDAGTVSNELLLESDTTAGTLADCDKVTVHVVALPDAMLDAVQVTELITVWVTSEMVAVWVPPL